MLKTTKNNLKIYRDIFNLALNQFSLKPNTITLMLSSGVDSIAVAHFIINNKHQFASLMQTDVSDLKVQAFHFNHKLRPQNEQMEQSTISFCARFNTHIITNHALTNLVSEMDARQARYGSVVESINNSIVVTAHHLDDCIESYLMNSLRGHEGYQPIPFCSRMQNTVLTHPFLFHSKEELKQYCCHHNLMSYVVEDETNKITRGSRRNFIRNELIPLLQKENIHLKKTVSNKMHTKLKQLIYAQAEIK